MGNPSGTSGFPLSRQRKRTSAACVVFATTDDWSVRRAPRRLVKVVAEIRGGSAISVLAGEVFDVGGEVDSSELEWRE